MLNDLAKAMKALDRKKLYSRVSCLTRSLQLYIHKHPHWTFFFSSLADVALKARSLHDFFRPTPSWLSLGRSNMFYCMLQIEINWLIMSYVGRLRLSGLKSELVKDRYIVLCTVTSHQQSAKRNKTKQNTKNKARSLHEHKLSERRLYKDIICPFWAGKSN